MHCTSSWPGARRSQSRTASRRFRTWTTSWCSTRGSSANRARTRSCSRSAASISSCTNWRRTRGRRRKSRPGPPSSGSRQLEDSLQRDHQVREQRRRQRCGVCDRVLLPLIPTVLKPKRGDNFALRIDDPVLLYAHPFVERALQPFVPSSRAGREDLHHQVRRPLGVLLRDSFAVPLLREVEQVRHDDVVLREDDVERRERNHAQTALPDVVTDDQMQVSCYELVSRHGRGRYVVLSVDQLVPEPIVGELHKVLVGHPDPLRRTLHDVILALEPIRGKRKRLAESIRPKT